MKKVLIALCLALCLSGCGRPANVSEDVYNLGLKAVEVTEQFISADLTADEAAEKLEEIESREAEGGTTPENVIMGEIYSLKCKMSEIDEKPQEEQMSEIKENLKSLENFLK